MQDNTAEESLKVKIGHNKIKQKIDIVEQKNLTEEELIIMHPSEEKYVRDILFRQEAARSQDGKLPPSVTHEIVEENDEKLPKIQRRRFSAF
ncbi:hypothetical protein IQ274_07095 [Nostoc sp. LEGE 12447]|uniref:hypothetical protein n=1 Tax=Nostoc sp. LEGE 12447 TaxID=1828640 RepID=UPI00188350E8|nr:hypothetical protein [Nostoc sp. LEGE 12447]MBE8997983.1 hypothetical protein [Nostoc sp. LEGE 12447]